MKIKDYKDFDTLEVGKTYKNRNMEEVKITDYYHSHTHPFWDSDGYRYNKYGFYYNINSKTDLDLITEIVEEKVEKVKEQEQELNWDNLEPFDIVKVGETYLSENNNVVEIFFYKLDRESDLIEGCRGYIKSLDLFVDYNIWGYDQDGPDTDNLTNRVIDPSKPVFINKEKNKEKKKDTPPLPYDFINPEHYKKYGKEVWGMMIDIWGEEKFIAFCEMNSLKYRMRLGDKPSNEDKDLQKAQWYEKKAKELKS